MSTTLRYESAVEQALQMSPAPFDPAVIYSFEASGEVFEIRLARDMEDRQRVWNFVHQVYAGKGYASGDLSQLWYGIYDALPNTVTFMAERAGRLVSSLTLVFDSPIHLPADVLYADELARLRADGRRLCEIVSLVSVEKQSSAAMKLIKHLFKLGYLAAYYLEDATDFIITVNPHHKAFYQRGMLFEQVGEERSYGKVNGAPAVLLKLDLVAAQTLYKEKFDRYEDDRNFYRFFRDRREEWTQWLQDQRQGLSPDEFVAHFIQSPMIRQKASLDQIAYVGQYYNAEPDLNLEAAAC